MNQFDAPAALQVFWSNVYLRGLMLHDQAGSIANAVYNQPYAGIPGARGWIIGPDQKIILPHFGHDPAFVIATIYDEIASWFVSGDGDGDGDVDLSDFEAFTACLGVDAAPYVEPSCRLFDFDEDGDVDCSDYPAFEDAFAGSSGFVPVIDLGEFVACIVGQAQNQASECLADVNKDGVCDGRDIPPYVAAALAAP